MNRRLYLMAGLVMILGILSMGTVAYLQGDFAFLTNPEKVKASKVVQIKLSESEVTSSLSSVQIEEDKVTITEGGRYDITGSASQVEIVVAKDIVEDVTIQLNNASFASLDFQGTGTNIVELAKDSTNVLSGGATGLAATNITVTGDGALEIKEVEQYGIFATEDLVVESGRLSIESAGSALYTSNKADKKHGNLTINGGELTIVSGESAGATGFYAANQLTINSGEITVEQAYEAYRAKKLAINGGTAKLTALASGIVVGDKETDEAELTISNGTTTVSAGMNAMQVNGNLTISGGNNSFAAVGAYGATLQYTGEATLKGGTVWLFGTGSFSEMEQAVLPVALTGNAGDTITVAEAGGNEIEAEAAPAAFTSVLYSSEKLTSGNTYFLSASSGTYGQGIATTDRDE